MKKIKLTLLVVFNLSFINLFAQGPVCDLCTNQAYVIANFGGDQEACFLANCQDIPVDQASWMLFVVGILFLTSSYLFSKFKEAKAFL